MTWSLEGSYASGTSISATGLLAVASDETRATVTVKATSTEDTSKSGTTTVTVTNAIPLPTYSISLSETGTYTFASATAGYGEQADRRVAVNNSGNRPTGDLTVALSGTDAGSFILSGANMAGIAVDGSDTFTVRPNTGLAAGTFTALVTVTGGNGISGSFTVSFTVSPAQPVTYVISRTIQGSDTEHGIAAILQLKDSRDINIGNPVTAAMDGSYTITGVPAGTYSIRVSCAGYDSGIIRGIAVSDVSVTGRGLTLQKTVVFVPVTGITMTNAAAVEVNTNLTLAGTVTPDNAANRTIVWNVEEAGGTGATIINGIFRAAAPGSAIVKAEIADGTAEGIPLKKTFEITVTAAPVAVSQPSPVREMPV